MVQIPAVLLALPTAIALRDRVVRREGNLDTSPDRPHLLANLALALLSAALTAALFLLVLLLVDGWRNSPAVAAVAVTAVPVAALAAGPLFRGVRAGTRSEAVAGSVLIGRWEDQGSRWVPARDRVGRPRVIGWAPARVFVPGPLSWSRSRVDDGCGACGGSLR